MQPPCTHKLHTEDVLSARYIVTSTTDDTKAGHRHIRKQKISLIDDKQSLTLSSPYLEHRYKHLVTMHAIRYHLTNTKVHTEYVLSARYIIASTANGSASTHMHTCNKKTVRRRVSHGHTLPRIHSRYTYKRVESRALLEVFKPCK